MVLEAIETKRHYKDFQYTNVQTTIWSLSKRGWKLVNLNQSLYLARQSEDVPPIFLFIKKRGERLGVKEGLLSRKIEKMGFRVEVFYGLPNGIPIMLSKKVRERKEDKEVEEMITEVTRIKKSNTDMEEILTGLVTAVKEEKKRDPEEMAQFQKKREEFEKQLMVDREKIAEERKVEEEEEKKKKEVGKVKRVAKQKGPWEEPSAYQQQINRAQANSQIDQSTERPSEQSEQTIEQEKKREEEVAPPTRTVWGIVPEEVMK